MELTNNSLIPDDNLSISQCKLLTHPSILQDPASYKVFGPKLSPLNRKSIDSNYKPHHSDSLDSSKEQLRGKSIDLTNNHLSINEKKRSNSNSLNCTKNNLHFDTSEANNSDESFRNFANNGTQKDPVNINIEKRYRKYRRFLENIYFNLFITLITIYALFASDFQAIFFTMESDIIFDSFSLFSMAVFIIEISMSFFIKPNYKFSFFFWLDLISTLSLLLDVTLVQDALLLDSSTSSSAHLARAGRASRFGTRASRILRMLRLIRIVKLYKSAVITKNEKEKLKSLQKTKTKLLEKKKTMMFDRSNSLNKSASPEKKSQKWYMSPDASPKKYGSPKRSLRGFGLIPKKSEVVSIITPKKERISVALSNDNKQLFVETVQEIDEVELLNQIEEEMSLKESKVGKKLSDLTIKRIIILVLLLIVIMPLMEASYWNDPGRCNDFGLKELQNLVQNNESSLVIETVCKNFVEVCGNTEKNYPMIYLSTGFQEPSCNFQSKDPFLLRSGEKLISEIDFDDYSLIAILDYTFNTHYTAVLSIIRTCFICFVLTIASLYITRDSNELVILPIERLIQKVNRLAENPLSIKDQRLLVDQDSDKKELVVIENSIIKITTLLALGYGEAGAEIIGYHLVKAGQIDWGLKGKKLYGVFGFCDIRNFTDATEVLQQDVMMFVNNIAEIVHSMVDRYAGSANKNIGDAFLLVWKFNDNLGYLIGDEEAEMFPTPNKKISDTCDLSLIAFCKIISKINREPKILKYRQDERLWIRIPNYKVKMGFGLHLGWAIEGAIGSQYKIDASYLSPHVNIASRLEAATKQYGVTILISNQLHRYFSSRFQTICRKIDCVTLKGSLEPVSLFTIDLNVDDLPISKNKENIEKEELLETNLMKKLAFLEGLESELFITEDVLDNDKAMKFMLKNFSVPFHEVFKKALGFYLNGEWKQAQQKFDEALLLKENDGPCKTLMAFMGKYEFEKPEDWKGYRELVDK